MGLVSFIIIFNSSAGSLYDEDGNYRKWWTNQSWKNFHNKTKCFEKQYSEYYEPKVDSHVRITSCFLAIKENN